MHLLPLHIESLDTLITPNQVCEKLEKSFADTLTVTSSSGESFTLAVLCMCTDWSKCPTEIPLLEGQTLQISGVSYTTASGALRCQQCSRMRLYRLTSLNTA
jgi:hypothetical protein